MKKIFDQRKDILYTEKMDESRFLGRNNANWKTVKQLL